MQATFRLQHEWRLGPQIGGGGFGRVFRIEGESGPAAAKFVRKHRGADRELLFVNIENARNIVPILESGEVDEDWVLVMPLAERSLRDYLDSIKRPAELDEALPVISCVVEALDDLSGNVVHRDIKPENILLLDGKWCLSDFGIARYADATTATNTFKLVGTNAYTAPERWRSERATTSSDIYSLGVVLFEALLGQVPFPGPYDEDFREQHLFAEVPPMNGMSSAVQSLIHSMLDKAPETRPAPKSVLRRLERVDTLPGTGGLGELQSADLEEVKRVAEARRADSIARSEHERQVAIRDSAARSLVFLGEQLSTSVLGAAPSAVLHPGYREGWTIELGKATLSLDSLSPCEPDQWKLESRGNFVTYARSGIIVRQPSDRYGYTGRSHSLLYGTPKGQSEVSWYEVGFMYHALTSRESTEVPFRLDSDSSAAEAFSGIMGLFQIAWSPVPLELDNLDEFIDRWAEWLARAVRGSLRKPNQLPER